MLLALVLAGSGCSSEGGGGGGGSGGAGGQGGSGGRGGAGGNRTGGSGGSTGGATGGTGGATGGTGGATGGSGGATGGNGGATGGTGGATGGSGGSGANDAGPRDAATGDATLDATAGDGGGSTGDAPAVPRPDAMGAACATGQNYGFSIRPFTSQTGTFTAWFTGTPSRAPTDSVIGLSDGMKYLHDDFAAIVRFGRSGMLDVRNGTAYSSVTPIRYEPIDYHFRLVVNVPAGKYSAYVSFKGMPEVTLGTDLAFRDSAGTVTKMNYWGVEAIAGSMTRVCGFLVQ